MEHPKSGSNGKGETKKIVWVNSHHYITCKVIISINKSKVPTWLMAVTENKSVPDTPTQ
jgi:hypothetical protein